jgi:peptide-methionine (S)-S-oxide reductase
MFNKTVRSVGVVLGVILALGFVRATTAAGPPFPDPAVDVPLAKAGAEETAVFAGGCFWGIEAVFEHVKGVKHAESGYAGGTAKTAQYELVGRGNTGHAESVRVTYDPSQVSYGRLLRIFFQVAHDPTQLNRQGPDVGPQYRSVVFYKDEEQKRVAAAYILQLREARIFPRLIVTKVDPLVEFFEAEDYHQDYAKKNPFEPYIMMYDAPKVVQLKAAFPAIFVGK